jgi:hypothetical protein
MATHFVETAAEPIGPRVVGIIELAHTERLPVLLEGPTGVGKSAIVAQAAQQLGIELVVIDLSLLEPPDLAGMPYVEDGVTHYAPPAQLPMGGRGILFLEELNRAERYVQQVALQLLTARRLHEYELPEGWSVLAAVNPETGEYQVNSMDPALRKRFLQLSVRADAESWRLWAQGAGIHASILALVETQDRMLDEVPPRSWEYASRVLRSKHRSEHALLRPALAGYLPGPWVELLLEEAAIEDDEGPSVAAEVVLRVYHRSQRLRDRVKALVQAGRTDQLDRLYRGVHAELSSEHLGLGSDDGGIELDSLEGLLADLPGDLREGLQEAFAANPKALDLLLLDGDLILSSYRRRSVVRRRVQTWVEEGRAHRALAVASDVARRLRSHPDRESLAADRRLRTTLGNLVEDLAALEPRDLFQALDELGIDIPRPERGDGAA